jgi:hypothetical protein
MISETKKRRTSATGRSTNLLLLVLLPLAVLTGLIANTAGTRWGIHPSVFHGIVAFAVLILSPWKQVIVRRGLGRRRKSSWISITLLVLVLSTLTTGIMHAFGYQGRIGPLTLMQVHVGGALIALVLAFLHYRSHPVRFTRSVDADRRSFLKAAGVTVGAALTWLGLEGTLDALGASGGERRFTGSHERGSFDPRGFPVTSWLDDRVQTIEGDEWVLRVGGSTKSLADIDALPHEEFGAVLDCTSAWYTSQVWTGVRLDRLVDPGSDRAIVVRSQTGFSRRFPASDIESLWLVTHVGGEPLSAGHGFPARIVAPGRRGFWWVKWVTEIDTSPIPWWIQLPFPAT